MQLQQLKPIHKNKTKKRVGRGGVHGSHCCKGRSGQRSRAGRKFKPVIRELIKRYPKLKGYKSKSFLVDPVVLNLDILDKKFESGNTVSPQILKEKKIIRLVDGQIPKVKILGKGELKKALIFENCLVSETAKEKIEKAGGEIKEVKQKK